MGFIGEIVSGFIHKGNLPQNSVSGNQHLYGSQGKKHLDEPGAPGMLDQAESRGDRRSIMTPKEQVANTEWSQQQQLAQFAAGRRS